MKIHSDHLDEAKLRDALATAKDAGLVARDVVLAIYPTGSRKRAHAWDCHLSTSEKRRPDGKVRHRAGSSISLRPSAATYDEWGHWLANVFTCDPNAIAGSYGSGPHFHYMTEGRYPGSVCRLDHTAVARACQEVEG